MIVWEDEEIINNAALEGEWAAVATATQSLPADTLVGCSGIKSNQNRIHSAPDVARARTHTPITYEIHRHKAGRKLHLLHLLLSLSPRLLCKAKERKRRKITHSWCLESSRCKANGVICLPSPRGGKKGCAYLFAGILRVSAGKLQRKKGGSG